MFRESRLISFCVVDVILSGIGTLISAIGIATWVVIFQVNRAEWGAYADDLSFNIPVGRP